MNISKILTVLVLVIAMGFIGSLYASAKPACEDCDLSQCKQEFNFQLIGYPEGQDYTGNCGNGHRIFVNRNANNALIGVVDDVNGWNINWCNATGNDRAEIDSEAGDTYLLTVRILGKPGGTLNICADTLADYEADEDDCLLGTIDLERGNGQSKFKVVPSAIYDASLEDLIWQTSTNGDYRNAQFRVWSCPFDM